MIAKRYFYIQQLSFALCGIDTKATMPHLIVKRPLLTLTPLFFGICHVVVMLHYAYVNRHDYIEATDSLAVSCQSLLSIFKMIIFLMKRKDFVKMINEVHAVNSSADHLDLPIILSENKRDDTLCTIYFKSVVVAAIVSFSSPILEAISIYFKAEQLILRPPYKATYPWNHAGILGYSLVYIWNVFSIFNLFSTTMAIDTLFTWMVSNISAQYHILSFRLNEAGKSQGETVSGARNESKNILKTIRSCLEYHKETLKLSTKLNQVYGEIIFMKFVISCSEICCLAFCLTRSNGPVTALAYHLIFMATVAMQLMLYCYHGQRIRDESLQVATEIYLAFDWSNLPKTCKNLLILPMMRSQNSSQFKGILFVLDLNLFLWAFKTAGSLIAALKTLEENQE